MVGGDPVDPGDDGAAGPHAVASQNPDPIDLHILRHTVCRSSDRTGDVRSVAVAVDAVLPISDGVEGHDGYPRTPRA